MACGVAGPWTRGGPACGRATGCQEAFSLLEAFQNKKLVGSREIFQPNPMVSFFFLRVTQWLVTLTLMDNPISPFVHVYGPERLVQVRRPFRHAGTRAQLNWHLGWKSSSRISAFSSVGALLMLSIILSNISLVSCTTCSPNVLVISDSLFSFFF